MKELNLREELFWDVNIDNIDPKKHQRFILNRVLLNGNTYDLRNILNYYGKDFVGIESTQMRYLDRKTLSFCSAYFDIPKEKFRCYTTDASIKKLWNY